MIPWIIKEYFLIRYHGLCYIWAMMNHPAQIISQMIIRILCTTWFGSISHMVYCMSNIIVSYFMTIMHNTVYQSDSISLYSTYLDIFICLQSSIHFIYVHNRNNGLVNHCTRRQITKQHKLLFYDITIIVFISWKDCKLIKYGNLFRRTTKFLKFQFHKLVYSCHHVITYKNNNICATEGSG